MSGRLKKMIWLILMTELVVLHIAVLARLYLFGHRTILILFLGGSLVMASVQYLTYRTFVKNCAKHIKEGSSVNKGEKACYESADEGKTWEYTGQVTFD